MKKKILFLLAGAMLCALPFVLKPKTNMSASASTIEQEQVQVEEEKWTKEDVKEILGYVAVGAGGVGTALAFAVPIYLKVKKAKDAILEANDCVHNEQKNNTDFAKRLEVSESYLRKQDYEFQKAMKHNADMIEAMLKELSIVKEICRLGFINNKELVSKGIATTISKVGQDEENKE